MSFVWRRSLPSLTGLSALLIGIGFAAVGFLKAPLWFPFAFAIAFMLLQYAINPRIIEWLVPASVIQRTADGYATDHPLGRIMAARCRQAGIPLVKLGIVEDGNPNAFTFGRTRRDARIWITRGLLERLDERELDAVVTHEIGHVKNRDFIVMTIAAVVPMVLYLVWIIGNRAGRDQARAVALAAYIGYVVARFTLLALSRAREYAADHWSCEATKDGDALCSALVKIAYGMGSVDATRKNEAMALAASGKRRKRQRVDTKPLRLQSMSAMGILDPRDAVAMETALAAGVDPQRAIAALRWDAVNPWARVLEKLSSHPIVAHRFRALEESGLPGKPSRWSVLRGLAVPPEQRFEVRKEFAVEAVMSVAPWAILIPLVLFGAFASSPMSIAIALIAAGLLLVVKQGMRYPRKIERVDQIASLIERLDASPVAGIDVEIKGRIVGRGMPGYVLSPDLVVQDESGFVPVLYANPIPFARTLFGLSRAEHFIGKDVVARGWYRRRPGPMVELREISAPDGLYARGYSWVFRYIGSALVIAAGFVVLVAGLTR